MVDVVNFGLDILTELDVCLTVLLPRVRDERHQPRVELEGEDPDIGEVDEVIGTVLDHLGAREGTEKEGDRRLGEGDRSSFGVELLALKL